jgi:hypothetical protein
MSGELRNRWASFRIQDVFIPDPEKLLVDLYGHNVLQGKIVDLSEGGRGETCSSWWKSWESTNPSSCR